MSLLLRNLFSIPKRLLETVLRAQGRRVTRSPLKKYLTDFHVDCLLDVGANVGQFASEARAVGYSGRIESFEPLSAAFAVLEKKSCRDAFWNIHRYALGERRDVLSINVSGNLPSSSFLDINEEFMNGTLDLGTVAQEQVDVRTLDEVFEEIVHDAGSVYLKLDTQGFEKYVIEGARACIQRVAIVQMELSLTQTYGGEALIEEMVSVMRGLGFQPWWILDGFKDASTLQLFQADVFFVNQDAAGSVS